MPLGYEWLEDWKIHKGPDTDEQGYCYASGWLSLNSKSKSLKLKDDMYTHVRRKKWFRTLVMTRSESPLLFALQSAVSLETQSILYPVDELVQLGQLTQSSVFVPYELLLTIKRANLTQGVTSSTSVEVFCGKDLIGKTTIGPSEWNQKIG